MPALKPKDFAPGEKLTPIADLPAWAQPAFKGMQTLNRVQSRVADMALKGVDNMLLCAPTGAGKTNVAMLAILHEIGKNLNEDNTLQLDNFKVVYVAPMKVSYPPLRPRRPPDMDIHVEACREAWSRARACDPVRCLLFSYQPCITA